MQIVCPCSIIYRSYAYSLCQLILIEMNLVFVDNLMLNILIFAFQQLMDAMRKEVPTK